MKIAGVLFYCLGFAACEASMVDADAPHRSGTPFAAPLQPVVGYENFHGSAPGDAGELNVRACHGMEMGDYDTAMAGFTQAIAYRPLVPQFYFNRGLCEIAKRQWSQALNDFDLSLKLKPAETKFYLYYRAVCRYNTHDFKGAMEDIDQVIDRNPEFAEAYQTRAFFRQAQGDQAGALADHTRAVALDPKLKGK